MTTMRCCNVLKVADGLFLCRRAVPLAISLLSVSNPTVGVMDMLSRLSHDSDQEVAQNAILALGALTSPLTSLFLTDHKGATKERSQ